MRVLSWIRDIRSGALAASILANLALAIKILVFDPNVRVQPLCWDGSHELVELDGPQTSLYRDYYSRGRGLFNSRVDADRYYYVSLIDRWVYEDDLWNSTTHVVAYLVQNFPSHMTLPPYDTDNGRVIVTCELARAVAIDSSPDQ
jgi:hypothetical protein